MSLNDTPTSMRTRITFLGKRNAGKSSLVNAITGQELSVVSDVAGTTTDPVNKSMELLPLGPVVITDTAGYDDVGTLGENTVEIALDGTSLNINGVAVDGIKINKGIVYVSANKIAASLGETATWDELSKTLTITKEVAQ